ncbi:MAG: FapA family protein [Candidatus Cloacimonetes bacterium]|nr:FapA family protein [Candidatus Cloacimonadota bacterium]
MNKVITNKAGNLVLELRQDTMSAWLTIKNNGKLIDEGDILALIEEAGIKTGFEEAIRHIRENSLEKDFDVPFPIAICNLKESTCTLRYQFNPDLQINFNAGINFTDLERISYVQAGAVVADYSSNLFEQGGSIYDIFGELINPGSIDEEQAASLCGNNVSFDKANREFITAKMGYPYLDDLGRICVLDTLVLSGEDIPNEAQIRTPLDVIIKGGLTCVNLVCGGNLHIDGELHASSVYVKGDFCIDGDILACTVGGVKVMGNLNCQSIRDSLVLCRQQLNFSGCIDNCTVACDGDILGNYENSEIQGGSIQAGGSISIANLGGSDTALTELEIAISPFYRAILMQMTRELIHYKEDSETNAEAIAELQIQIKKAESDLDEQLNAFLRRPIEDKKSVIVHRDVRPPLSIRVLKHSYEIKSPQQGLEIIEKE